MMIPIASKPTRIQNLIGKNAIEVVHKTQM